MKTKLFRTTTVPISLEKLLENQLRFMGKYFDVTMISSDAAHLEKVGKLQDSKVHHIEMTRQITPLKDLAAIWKMYLYFKKQKPQIVHSHTPKAGLVSMIAAWMANVPNRLHTVAGLPLLEARGIKRTILDFVEKITYACANKIYPNSQGLCQIILENKYCDANKLKVIANGSSNGINTSYFDPKLYSEKDSMNLRAELDIYPGDFVFVFVGRLVTDKGINELVKAFARLNAEFPNTKLLLVGDYEKKLDPILPQTEKAIKGNPAIISTGFRTDVRPYFALSQMLVLPTYREGFPNVVLQAGSMGLPSIVTNINGCNEIISDGVNGLIIPVKDENAIFGAMKTAIQNDELFEIMQAGARDQIVSRFEQQVVWDALLAEYKSLDDV